MSELGINWNLQENFYSLSESQLRENLTDSNDTHVFRFSDTYTLWLYIYCIEEIYYLLYIVNKHPQICIQTIETVELVLESSNFYIVVSVKVA